MPKIIKIDKQSLKKVSQGDRRLLSKLLGRVETMDENEQKELVSHFLTKKNRPMIFGITGTPGAGKSTFISQILKTKDKAENIGMLLIDPSNPVVGGAILGDRIRMVDFFLDTSIFIRSIADKALGDGLGPFLEMYLMLMSCYPFRNIFVETVGGGQSNIGICSLVDKTILIFDPGSGDSIQHLKSGILDLADLIIISKADLVNCELVKLSLQQSLARETKIICLNLIKQDTKENNLYRKEILSSKQKLSPEKIIVSFLSRTILLKFKNNLDVYLKKQVTKNKISDKFIRDILINIPKYFSLNS